MSLARSFQRFRNKNKKIQPLRNKVHFEPLEPRVLLNSAPSFSVGDGVVLTDFGSSDDSGAAMALLADGRLVVAGTTGPSSFDQHFALLRYQVDGSLDTSLDGDGKLTTVVGTRSSANALAVQADGRVVAVGLSTATSSLSNADFALVRYNLDGSLDTSFDGDGKLTLSFNATGFDIARAVLIQPDGKIVVAGSTGVSLETGLVRLNSDGSLDTSFSADGKVTLGNGFGTPKSLVLQSDGKILVGGGSYHFSLARFNADGSHDTSFGVYVDGWVSTSVAPTGGSGQYGDQVLLQPDGKILLTGSFYDNSLGVFALGVVRYNANGGSLDTSFDGDGKRALYIGEGGASAGGAVLQADGRIVMAGSAFNGTNDDVALLRLNPDGSLDRGFDVPVNTLDGAPTFNRGGAAVVLDSNVRVYDADLALTGNYSGATLTLARSGGVSAQDVFSAKSGGTLGTLIQGASLTLSGTSIGTVTTNSGGTLVLTFNSFATQALVDATLQQIAYSNNSLTPPSSVQIGWSFNDGNSGSQGAGGALQATGSTTVHINTLPTGTVTISGTATEGQTLTVSNTLADGDGLGAVSYQWQASSSGGVWENLATGTSLILLDAYVGRQIRAVASYTDGGGTLESVSSAATAAVVNLNAAPSFAVGDGKVTTAGMGSSYDSVLQPDGKLVVVGGTGNSFALARYNADGSLDTSFDGDGKLTTSFPSFLGAYGFGIALQPDGKIVVAGRVSDGASPTPNTRFALARYNADGSLDTSFDGDGRLVSDLFVNQNETAFSVLVQPDGRIIAAGMSSPPGSSSSDFVVVRYNADGSFDNTFSGDGGANSIALQSDGKILVTGSDRTGGIFGDNMLALARYNADGSLDASFSGDGLVTVDIGSNGSGQDIAVQADGRILVVGSGGSRLTLLRYNADGSLDTGFDGDGKLITDFGTGSSAGQSVLVQPNGKIVAAGYASNGLNNDFALARYNANGSLDTGFDGDGKLLTDFAAGSDQANSVSLQSDGRILVSGSAVIGGSNQIALARYNSDGSLDLAFDTQVNTLDASPTYNQDAPVVVLDSDVRVYDVELAAAGNYAGAILTLARGGGASAQDVFSAKPGGTLGALTQGASLTVSGTSVGTVTTNSGGTLRLTFNSAATQAMVDATLQQIAYSNNSPTAPATVQIDWTFSDGNSGAQGAGGAQQATGSTSVTVTLVNDAPVADAGGPYTVAEGATLILDGSGSSDREDNIVSWEWDLDGDGQFDDATGETTTYNWADNGSYLASLKVTDSYAESTIDTVIVTVLNVVPTVNVGSDATIEEGRTFSRTGSLADPGADSWAATVDYGDGSGVQQLTLNPDKTFYLSHVYADNGAYTLTVTVNDDDSGAGTDTLTVTVNNVTPTLNAGADQTVNEGQTISLDPAVFNDLGTSDTHTAAVNWGDGTATEAGTVTESPFGPPGSVAGADGTVSGSHVYADNGTYTVTISVMDDDGAVASDSLLVTVQNVAPTAEAEADQEVDEGAAVSFVGSFVDPGTADTHTIAWDFGDGATTDGTLSTTHVYADNGDYTVTLTVTDDDGAVTSDTLLVTVNNVAPSVDAGVDQTVNEGDIVSLNPATFNDLGTLDTHTATIDWGDGIIESGTVTESPFGSPGSVAGADGTVSGSHVYADNGTYTVTVSVMDDDGGGAVDTFNVTVNNVTPTLDAGADQTVDEGSVVSLAPATFNDLGTLDTHTATINWGDGTTTGVGTVTESPFGPPGSPTGMNGTVSGSHVYADNGTYKVTVTVTDDDGGSTSDTLTVTVLNVAPTVIQGIATQSVQYSDAIQAVVFTVTDPSIVDSMNAVTSYRFESGAFVGGLPDALSLVEGLSFSGDADQVDPATWILSGIADMEPGRYVIRVTVTDDDGGTGVSDTMIVVDQEDARATYAGPLFVSTDPRNPGNAVVPLRAVIRDISLLTGDSAYDPEAGNITTAKVTFINRETNAIIASDLPVALIDSDIATGVATYDWRVSLNSTHTAKSFTIGIRVDGFYDRNQADDNVVVTVARPDGDFITGGGYLINEDSFGAYAGSDGLNTNFGFNIKFNKKMTNLQGHFNGIVRRDDGAGGIRVFQIKSTATQSLVVNPTVGDGVATFISKANLTDITDPLNPIGIAGNLSLIVTLTDNGEPGSSDTIGFTLWNGSQLWFSSNWTGTKTKEQVLAGGNLAVHANALALQAAGGAVDEYEIVQMLKPEMLKPIVEEAISRLAGSFVDSKSLKALEDVEFQIADLDGSTLGLAFGDTVWIDLDAAGYGWFIDSTPYDNSEFKPRGKNGRLVAVGSSPAIGDMDLLTVVTHEMGHVLGFEDLNPEANLLMSGTLDAGERHLVGETNNQNQGGTTKLVMMDSTEAAIPTLLEQPQRPWLADFLVNGSQDGYNNPNSDIRIKMFDENKEDTNSILRRMYGKRTRP